MTKTVGPQRKPNNGTTIQVAEKANAGSLGNRKTRVEHSNDVQQANARSRLLVVDSNGATTPRSLSRSPVRSPIPASTSSLIRTSAIYRILSKKERNFKTLSELNNALKSKESQSLLNVNDPILDGTFLHFLTQSAQANDDVSWRMVYSLSNAGIDVNQQNSKGNTALHLAYMRGFIEVGFNFIEALLKTSPDLDITNSSNNVASNYMEDIEQLNSMYNAHFPSIWSAVENGQDDEVQRLMNAWIKVSALRKSKRLIDVAKENANKSKSHRNLLDVLEKNSLMIDLTHAIFATDAELFGQLMTRIGANFQPNMADFCYCFSWYRPIGRNLPRFIFEIALDAKNAQIVSALIEAGCDINLYHTRNGNPFYFCAYEEEFQCLKEKFIANADLSIKSQRGENVLFHIVSLYANANSPNVAEYGKQLISDFNGLLLSDPMLMTQRDQDEVSLIESIICMPPGAFKRAVVFLKELSDHLVRIVNEDNSQIIKNMILKSYGLNLLHAPIFPPNSFKPNAFSLAGQLTFEEYIEDKSNAKSIKKCLRNFEENYISMLCQFRQAVKIGDLATISRLMEADKNKWLVYSRDHSGRSCLHLAVLYGQASVVKHLLQADISLIDASDNLNRTCTHYAYALDDKKIINCLHMFSPNLNMRDAKFLTAEEYANEEVRNDEWFRVKNFKLNELKMLKGLNSFMKCFYYAAIKNAIDENDKNELGAIGVKLNRFGLSYREMPYQKTDNSWIEGRPFVSLLEYAMEKRSFSAFRFILENGLDTSSYSAKSRPNTSVSHTLNSASKSTTSLRGSATIADRLLTARSRLPRNQSAIEMCLNSLREKAEEEQIDEIIDILDNFGEDLEIKAVTNEEASAAFGGQGGTQGNKKQAMLNAKKDNATNAALRQKLKQEILLNKRNSKANLKDDLYDTDSINSSFSKTCTIL